MYRECGRARFRGAEGSMAAIEKYVIRVRVQFLVSMLRYDPIYCRYTKKNMYNIQSFDDGLTTIL